MTDPMTEPDDVGVEKDLRSVHRHDLDPISVAFGVIFAALGLAFLLGDIDASELSGAWGWAGLFGAAGFLLLAMGVRRQRR